MTQDGRGGQAEPRGRSRVADEASLTERTIYISPCTFSLTATQFPVPSGELLTVTPGLKCNLWGSQRLPGGFFRRNLELYLGNLLFHRHDVF